MEAFWERREREREGFWEAKKSAACQNMASGYFSRRFV